MKYKDFRKKVEKYPLITGNLLKMLGGNERSLRNQLNRWQKAGSVLQLRRGFYQLNPDDQKVRPSTFYLANHLVFPSYISLESALAFYHIIPEAVYQPTSVTTKKTISYRTPDNYFSYRHLKPSLFFGFTKIEDEANLPVFMATPEKALLDFLYLNSAQFSVDDTNVFSESFRFAGEDLLDSNQLLAYAKRFQSQKLLALTKQFIKNHLGDDVDA